ncbi:MAG: hypothetical protein ABIK45_10545 [Pseudomonadota bacterium]
MKLHDKNVFAFVKELLRNFISLSLKVAVIVFLGWLIFAIILPTVKKYLSGIDWISLVPDWSDFSWGWVVGIFILCLLLEHIGKRIQNIEDRLDDLEHREER